MPILSQKELTEIADDIEGEFHKSIENEHSDIGDMWDLLGRIYENITGEPLEEWYSAGRFTGQKKKED